MLAKTLRFHLTYTAFVAAFLILGGESVVADPQNSVYEKRLAYIKAKQALRAGRSSEYRTLRDSLAGYVLHPYLIYYENQGRLSSLKPETILELRELLSHTTLGDRLFEQWLAAQALRHRWSVYAEYYERSNDSLAECNYLRALFHLRRFKEMERLAPKLWVAGESQPKACDPAFARWIQDGHVNDQLAWNRLKLALDNRSWQLSRYLFRFFSNEAQHAARAMYNVHRQPSRSKNVGEFRNNAWGRDAWLHGLIRLARTDAAEANAAWLKHRSRFDFDPNVEMAFESDLAFWLAREGVVPHEVNS